MTIRTFLLASIAVTMAYGSALPAFAAPDAGSATIQLAPNVQLAQWDRNRDDRRYDNNDRLNIDKTAVGHIVDGDYYGYPWAARPPRPG